MANFRGVVWRNQARADLRSIFSYIARDNPDAAESMRGRILNKVIQLSANPRAYRLGRLAGTREMVVHPSYLVIYRESPDEITILRVLHAAQRWP